MGQTCPTGTILEAGLCYEPAKAGYNCYATTCYQDCPAGYPDSNATFCENSYNRGTGNISKTACEQSGNRGASTNGCKEIAGLWYPICDSGYTDPSGICIGFPYVCVKPCPSGWDSTCLTCEKPTYTRPAGSVPSLSISWTTIFIILLVLILAIILAIKI